jgi:hypothetical protein
MMAESTSGPSPNSIRSSVRARPPWMRRVGWGMSGLMILFMMLDGLSKLALERHVIEATAKIGYPASSIQAIGIIGLVCTIIYAIPRPRLTNSERAGHRSRSNFISTAWKPTPASQALKEKQ